MPSRELPPLSSAASDNILPFTVLLKKDNNVDYRGVVFNSKCYYETGSQNKDGNKTYEIVGLLSTNTPKNTDSGWAKLKVPEDKIWLEVDVSSSTLKFNIKSLGAGDEFGGGLAEHSGAEPPSPTKIRVLIATTKKEGTAIKITQIINCHRKMGRTITDCFDSAGNKPYTIVAPYPFAV